MFSTQNQRDFEAELTQLVSDEGYEYAAGYFNSLLVEMLNLLPKRRQKFYIDMLKAGNDNKLVEVKSLMTGEKTTLARKLLGGPCDPSTEQYWSM